jgi:hypothetical protein
MVDTPNMTATQYDATIAEMGGKLPDGCSVRIAGVAPDGSWRVVSVWDDMETARALVTATLQPVHRPPRAHAGTFLPPQQTAGGKGRRCTSADQRSRGEASTRERRP